MLSGRDDTAPLWQIFYDNADSPGSPDDEAAQIDALVPAPLVIVPLACKDIYLSRYAEPDKGWSALGAGKTVSRAAPAGELRDAASQVLATPAFQQAARRLARLIERQQGAANGASALENWLSSAATSR